MKIIRNAKKQDIRFVVQLFESFMSDIAIANPEMELNQYTEKALMRELRRLDAYYLTPDRNAFFVGLVGKEIVGCIGCEKYCNSTAEMRRLIVCQEYRRQGWGRQLITHLESECIEMGYTKILLETSELQPEAVSLYQHMGYHLEASFKAVHGSHKSVSGITRYKYVRTLK